MSAQFVTYQDHTYELTLTGKCALSVYSEFEEKIEGVIGAQPLLSMLPADASIDPLFLADAEIHTSSPEIPDSVINELFESIEHSDELYGIAPVAIVGQLEAFYDAATAGGTQVEMIIDEQLFERLLQAPDSRQVMVESVRRERTNIYTASIPFGYGLWAGDDEAGVVVYTDTGIGGIALNDSDKAISWAKSMFDALNEDATLMTLSDIGEA
ncbi:helix-turn-helix transcriptional regulator [Haloferax namakaokahaiae]|uniref:Helix-turn-helix transcriptional regulator n=1 Tax=Haloferax namakaokahaiae TaxID=1748331 RepID=A0ABD5ZAI1_9EURY